jgi:hydrogenase maturation protein HypF
MAVGRKIQIKGIVQGVGFRPFIFGLAKKNHISGWVKNSSAGVEIVANGQEKDVSLFINGISNQHPPLSKIDSITIEEINPANFSGFEILQSQAISGEFIPVSPDVSICDDCFSELFDPNNHRFRYPFINCTNCGPRFTIIKDIPYDRPLTTMAGFKMCAACRKEYENPLDRRFHAQPIACPDCGPRIWFEDGSGDRAFGEEGLQIARSWIKSGKIIAIKGLGGFHLACDAFNAQALETLRSRKKRSDKPFAVMVFNESIAEKHCEMNVSEHSLLNSKEKPIVVLRRRSASELPLAIAPNVNTIGIMLPYTPLHYLLLEPEPGYPEVLVMTSGNMSEEPIVYSNSGAQSELGSIADGFLLHDRDIKTRVDDSVLTEINGQGYFFRRSRGFAPDPIRIGQKLSQILSVGAELKNTFCLTRDNYAFLSHHIGDLQNLETLNAFEEGIPHYEKLFRIDPQAIACDLHPDYLSTRYAEERACRENIPLIHVQHHHAHLASVLADNNYVKEDPVIGVCLDGTGYGSDGAIWGCEFLYGGYAQADRKFHLEYMPLPGGDSATLHPAKVAAAYLWKNGLEWSEIIPSIRSFSQDERSVLLKQLQLNINCPVTSSMGRLFDAVASLADIRHSVNYEAQAAIEMENCLNSNQASAYHFEIQGQQIMIAPLLREIIFDIQNNVSKSDIAAKFHNGIRSMVVDVCSRISQETGCKTIALSGGVWQNKFLLVNTVADLKEAGYTVLFHRQVPANDGGLALGQAMIANFQLNKTMR